MGGLFLNIKQGLPIELPDGSDSRLSKMMRRLKIFSIRFALSLVLPGLLLLVWHISAKTIDNQVILPHVQQVADMLFSPTVSLIGMGSLTRNILVSLVRVLMGYLAGAILAIPLGVLMGYYSLGFRLCNTFFNLFRPIPPLAWVPLVMAWFGVASLATSLGLDRGIWYVYLNNLKYSMIFIIFIGAFYPILSSTIHGVRNVRRTLLDSALVLGASEFQVFYKILIPAAAPSIVNGMRIGLGIAWMCLVSAEMLPGSMAGVGYLITHAYTVAHTDVVIAGMISIGAIGAVLDGIFRFVEEHYFAWQHRER
jgi:NitT/TauT family transport system permease protein